MLSLRAQRSNLVTTESPLPEIATSPSAPRNDEFSFVLAVQFHDQPFMRAQFDFAIDHFVFPVGKT